MKSAEECNSIEEIRTCIDEIDGSIITGLAARSLPVKRAADFKETFADVKAHERVRSMIAARRRWAGENGVNADFIESLFGCIVGHFIGKEAEEWNRDKSVKI